LFIGSTLLVEDFTTYMTWECWPACVLYPQADYAVCDEVEKGIIDVW